MVTLSSDVSGHHANYIVYTVIDYYRYRTEHFEKL